MSPLVSLARRRSNSASTLNMLNPSQILALELTRHLCIDDLGFRVYWGAFLPLDVIRLPLAWLTRLLNLLVNYLVLSFSSIILRRHPKILSIKLTQLQRLEIIGVRGILVESLVHQLSPWWYLHLRMNEDGLTSLLRDHLPWHLLTHRRMVLV